MNNNYQVKEEINLINILINKMKFKHKKAKMLLTNELVLVNDKVITKYNYIPKKDDIISIRNFNDKSISNDIKIIYEDKYIIVLNKPNNLLTISTSSEKEKTLFHFVSDYVKERNKNAKIFVVHRLDKETSGVVLFAKSEKIKALYQNNWNNLVKYRGYLAVVEGKLDKEADTIKINLKENDNLKVYVNKNGKEAITSYKVLKSNLKYSLLDVEIKTGRKNQIRVTMEYLRHPIIGDKKYSSKDNSLNRLGLHAYKLELIDPITKKYVKYEAKVPKKFYDIVK